ncbi:hypothetical protein, partial [Gordonia paraffinivorans]|uniref:hypothetical protein n=1 Tax=Gordonia paraffinivorans TaxID=175628 RepID=UPI00242B277F
MGETLPAKLANFRTAMGRLSAAGMEPFLVRAKSGVTDLTGAINTLTPKMKTFAVAADAKIFDEWAPKIREAFEALQNSGAIDDAKQTFVGLFDALRDLGPSARVIATSLAEASASLGVGGWQLFLATVQAASGIMQGLTPVLETVGDLMQAHPGAVTAALAAWMAFKTVPSILGRISTALTPVTTGVGTMGRNLSGVRPAITGFGDAYRTSLGYVRQANPQISTAGAHIRVLGVNAGMAARGGISALSNALGGPLNVGLMAAGALLMTVASQHGENSRNADTHKKSIDDLTQSQLQLGAALRASRGQMTESTWGVATEQIEGYKNQLKATADLHQTWWEQSFTVKLPWQGTAPQDEIDRTNEQAEAAMRATAAMRELGKTDEEVAQAVYGSSAQWDVLRNRLEGMGDGGRKAAQDLQALRDVYVEQRDAAARVTPGIS